MIRWSVNPGSVGNRGSIKLCRRLGICWPISLGGNCGLCLFLVLLIFAPCQTLLIAAMPDPNQEDSPSLSPEAKLLQEFHAVVQTLREERTAFYEKQRQIENHIEQRRNDLASLESQVAQLRADEQQVDQDLIRVEQDVKQLEIELHTNKENQARLQKNMDEWIRKELQAVDEGIPFRRKERRERLVPTEQVTPEPESMNPADTLGRIWIFFQEEMRIARSGEIFTKQIDIGNNRVKYAQIFRVGHQLLGYLTEDGEQTGSWIDHNGRKQWQHNLKKNDARTVQTAVEILDRRQKPKLISLPISIHIECKHEGQKPEREKSAKE